MNEVTVAVVQSTAVREHARLAIQAAQQGARLVVFFEPGLAPAPDESHVQMLQQIADAHGIVMVAGALCFRPRQPVETRTEGEAMLMVKVGLPQASSDDQAREYSSPACFLHEVDQDGRK
ncbi:MAG: hypothetical protein ABW171_07860 [Steroidobacter sp.]